MAMKIVEVSFEDKHLPWINASRLVAFRSISRLNADELNLILSQYEKLPELPEIITANVAYRLCLSAETRGDIWR